MANFVQMMQKAGQVKSKMEDMQNRVRQMDITGEAGRGLVTCVINGRFEVKKVKIDPSVIKAEEADVLEDLVVAALNDARVRVEKLLSDETEKIMKDMGLPPGLGLPF